jgi:hypothetical protein
LELQWDESWVAVKDKVWGAEMVLLMELVLVTTKGVQRDGLRDMKMEIWLEVWREVWWEVWMEVWMEPGREVQKGCMKRKRVWVWVWVG